MGFPDTLVVMHTGCLGLISGKSVEVFVVAVLVIGNFSGHPESLAVSFFVEALFPFLQ